MKTRSFDVYRSGALDCGFVLTVVLRRRSGCASPSIRGERRPLRLTTTAERSGDRVRKCGQNPASMGGGPLQACPCLHGAQRSVARVSVVCARRRPRAVEHRCATAGGIAAGRRGTIRSGPQSRAKIALEHDPRNVQAHIVLGNALAGLKDLRQADRADRTGDCARPVECAGLERARRLAAQRRRRGNAASAFERAVALDPSSIDARLSLASYHWAKGNAAAAEHTLRDALASIARHPLVHRSLALFYMTTGGRADAEPHFKALAARDDAGPAAAGGLLPGVNRHEDAARSCNPVSGSPDKTVARAARLRLAAIEYAGGKKAGRLPDRRRADRRETAPGGCATQRARMLLSDGRAHDAAIEIGAALKRTPDRSRGTISAWLGRARRNGGLRMPNWRSSRWWR